jgi:Phage portal protein
LPTILERIQAAASAFSIERKSSSGPPVGHFNSSWIGGPSFTDAWGSKRAPSPPELVEYFKSLVYSCVMINANIVSAVPLKLYVDASTGKKPSEHSGPKELSASQFRHLRSAEYVGSGSKIADIREIRDHQFLYALNNPDPYDILNLVQLLKLIVMYNDTVGACYLYPEGEPYRWLWALHSQYVYPVINSASPIPSGYTYGGIVYKPEQLVCFRINPSLKNPYAANYSPLYAAVEYAKLEDKFVSIQEQLMAMGPRPNLLATPSDPNMPPGSDEKDRFEQDLNRKHARGAQGGVLVTTGAWKVQPIAYSPADLSGLKIAEYDLERICACFGVPIEFFTSDTNLANQQAAAKKHAEFAVNPRCKSIASRLTRIVRKWDHRLFFAFDNPVAADREMDAKLFDMAVKNGTMTINQHNAELGLPLVSWGDEPWLPNTLAQPSVLTKMNEAAVAMSQAGAVGLADGGGNPAVGNKDVKKDKSKGGESDGKKPSASDQRSAGDADAGVARAGLGFHDQELSPFHGEDGRLTEGEDRDPFSHLSWSVDPPSAAGT